MKFNLTIILLILLSPEIIFSQEISLNREIKLKTPKHVVYYEKDFKFDEYLPDFKNIEKGANDTIFYAENIKSSDLKLPANVEIVKVKLKNQKLILLNANIPTNKRIKYSRQAHINIFYSKAKNEDYFSFRINPFIKKNNQTYFLGNFTLEISYRTQQRHKNRVAYAASSVLSSGNWYKFRVKQNGVYKISFAQLQEIGFSTPVKVRVFGNTGGMLPMNNSVPAEDDLNEKKIWKTADAIYFYAASPNSWAYNPDTKIFEHLKHIYSDYQYYFLTDKNTGFDNEIKNITINQIADFNVIDYNYFSVIEKDIVNLVESGRTWYGDIFDINDKLNYTFDVPDIVSTEPAIISLKAAVRAFSPSSISLIYKGQSQNINYAAVSGSFEAAYAYDSERDFSFNPSNSEAQSIDLKFNRPSPSDKAWIDFIRINCKRKLVYHGNSFNFRNQSIVSVGKYANYRLSGLNSDCRIWNISNQALIKNIDYNLSGSDANFIYPSDKLEEFVIFEPKKALKPELTGDKTGFISNQNLHSLTEADMIIVAPAFFIDEAKELAKFHTQTDNLKTEVVELTQIYNEFSSGTPDVTAIRNFLRMIYFRSQSSAHPLRLLTLFGDGSYKNKQAIRENWNTIPTYQSVNATNPITSFVSDDFFGMMNANEYETVGNLDIGIGRIPVDTKSSAQIVLNKIKNYYLSKGDWKNIITLIGDDEDGNTYMRDAENYAAYISSNYPNFNLDKIYLDAYKQVSTSAGDRYPDVVRAINARMQKGCLILNYIGHGNPYRLAHEKVIDIGTINSWTNYDALPVFMTATCEFSRYDQSDIVSAGEQVLLNPQGGAVALFTTTRLVFSGSNDMLNTNFYKNVFLTDNITGKQLYLGDIVRASKLATGSPANINKRNFSLLGDPALRLLFPTKKIQITKINKTTINYDITQSPTGEADTIKALQKIEINGRIIQKDNSTDYSFNGIVIPRILDKKINRKTRANDGGSTMNFSVQNNAVFHGKSEISKGKFKFSFIVPKDIGIAYDWGKMSLYAHTNQEDEAACSFTHFIIGGIDTSAVEDSNGPDIQIYLNNERFISGGMTNQEPILFARLSDSSGINTSSGSIGHDITAVIDDNTAQTIRLNNFYEADLNKYTTGKIKFQLSNLKEGKHSLKVKAWDVYNNSSEKSVDFVVAKNTGLEIEHLYNYPNPFFNQTAFYFEHNVPFVEIQVMIQIFTISGQLVKTIHSDMNTTGFRSEAIIWDGLDDFGQKIGRGTYFYRLKIKTSNGLSAEKIEKLVKLN